MHRFISVSTLLIASVLTACAATDDGANDPGDHDNDNSVILVSDATAVNAHVEELFSGSITGSAALRDYRTILSQQDAVTALNVVAPPQAISELSGAVVRDAVPWVPSSSVDKNLDRGSLILTDDALWFWTGNEDQSPQRSPIADAIDVAALRSMASLDGLLWLGVDDAISLWWNGWIHGVQVADSPIAPPFAVTQASDGRPVVWASNEGHLVALTGGGANWSVAEIRQDLMPEAMVAAGRGTVWVVADGLLYCRDAKGNWQPYQFAEPVRSVAANPSTPRIWVATESSTYLFENGEFIVVNGVPAGAGPEPWDVDEAGRLLVRGDSSLTRVSVGRPVALLGIPEDGVIFTSTEVVLAPTSAASAVGLDASFNGQSLAMDTEDAGVWRAVLEPENLPAGSYELAVTVQYSDGDDLGQWSIIVTNPTWQEDILPLFRDRCAICHAGDTGSAVLDTPESWQSRFIDLVDRVERNNMPLGGTPLSAVEKATIRAWGAKGFPIQP